MSIEPDGSVSEGEPIPGDRVRDVLGDMGYEPDALRGAVARGLSARRAAGLGAKEDEHDVLSTFSLVLDDYTYLV